MFDPQSILRKPERRSLTARVSFDNRLTLKELHDDGTCDITNLFLRQGDNIDMELTLLEVHDGASIESSHHNITSSDMDISSSTLVEPSVYQQHDRSTMEQTLMNDTVFSEMTSFNLPNLNNNNTNNNNNIANQSHYQSMDNSILKQFTNDTMMALDNTMLRTIQDSMRVDAAIFSRVLEGLRNQQTSLYFANKNVRVVIFTDVNETLVDISCDLHKTTIASENFESQLQALKNDLIDKKYTKVDVIKRLIQLDLQARTLEAEIETLQSFHRWVIKEGNPIELAIKIRGLRHPLWLIMTFDSTTYPCEEIHVRFAVNKNDRSLYPFTTFATAIKNTTKCGQPFYITNIIVSAKKFIKFYKKSLKHYT